MRIHILWVILASQLLCLDFVKAEYPVHPETLKCAETLGLSNELEILLDQRQKVTQNPREDYYFQFIRAYYNPFVEKVLRTLTAIPQSKYLHNASARGDHFAINDLITNQGVDVDNRGPFGFTALSVADDVSTTRQLLALKADANLPNVLGHIPLHSAAFSDTQPDRIFVLLDYGSDIEAQDLLGRTPIISAIENGNVNAFRALRSRGASLSVRTIGTPNALLANYLFSLNFVISVNSSDEVVTENYDKEAQRKKRTTMARLILDEDPSFLHTVDFIYQATALDWAGFFGDVESINLYLERGLSPKLVNGNKETPLHVAARSNQVAAFLRLQDIDPHLMTAVDKDGLTPEESARRHHAWDVLRAINSRNSGLWPNFFIP